jgi:hypothetical protein
MPRGSDALFRRGYGWMPRRKHHKRHDGPEQAVQRIPCWGGRHEGCPTFRVDLGGFPVAGPLLVWCRQSPLAVPGAWMPPHTPHAVMPYAR